MLEETLLVYTCGTEPYVRNRTYLDPKTGRRLAQSDLAYSHMRQKLARREQGCIDEFFAPERPTEI